MTAPGPAGPPASYPGSSGPAGPPSYGPPVPPTGPQSGPMSPAGPVPASGVPAPPPGPGAAPPFAAPPIEGRGRRMWIGIGVAALAVLICCGGGTAAVIGFGVSSVQAINEQARTVVGDYFDAVINDDLGTAYGLLCPSIQGRESRAEFERRVAAEPEITAYQVGEVSITAEVFVPVDVTYTGGNRDTVQALLARDTKTNELQLCGFN